MNFPWNFKHFKMKANPFESDVQQATEASRDRLRNLKEDMINLNVKVDNITEKLIMDRLGLIDKTTESLGTDKNRLKRIEENLDKIKSYAGKSCRILEKTPRRMSESDQTNHKSNSKTVSRRARASRSRSPAESRKSSSSSGNNRNRSKRSPS